MSVKDGLEWTFDQKASLYEKIRPGYVKELYRKIFDYCPIKETSHVAEVGIGTGQATLPILKTNCQLTAIEYGEHLANLCREKFRDFPKFSVMTGKFEEVDLETEAYDLIFSATAFHWIPEEMGYSKVFSLLKRGGAFARFANHPYRAKDNPVLSKEIDKIYGAYYYKYYDIEQKTPKEFDEEDAKHMAEIALKYGFCDIQYHLFNRTRILSAKEYVELLGTYSDHISMEEKIRTEFFAKIEEVINKHGGEITIYDIMDLQLARKP